jgi:hypothetical protein
MATGAELPIDTTASALEMAELIFGDAVLIHGATYSGNAQASGIYTNGDTVSPDATPSDTGVILSTGRVTDFTQSGGDPNRSGGTSSTMNGVRNDAELNALANAPTFDGSILEVDFTPDTDFLSIQFVFASEEYPEYSNSAFNDIFGVWVGPDLTPVTSPIFNVSQVNAVNQNTNETLFINNTGDDFNTEMDGFTVTLSMLIPVEAGVRTNLKFGIADVGDSGWDSSVLIAANSVQGSFAAEDDTITVNEQQVSVLDVVANDGDGIGLVFVTHINGQPIAEGQTVTLSSGHEVTLLAGGNLQITPPADQINLTGPESIDFSYTAQNEDGLTDTAFVTVTAIPCFTPGTPIRTPEGDRPVETLAPGDLVDTRDAGPQPLRWIGRRRVPATGRFAPVLIEAGTFGNHARLVVSPQHRILLTHWAAELLFGEDEVLVAAKDLVNGCSVRVLTGGHVDYIHLLFDRHQIVASAGIWTESFLPGPAAMTGLDAAVRHEVLTLFPEIDPDTHLGYGPCARPALRGFEARAILG